MFLEGGLIAYTNKSQYTWYCYVGSVNRTFSCPENYGIFSNNFTLLVVILLTIKVLLPVST
jgi:hypothetical protein